MNLGHYAPRRAAVSTRQLIAQARIVPPQLHATLLGCTRQADDYGAIARSNGSLSDALVIPEPQDASISRHASVTRDCDSESPSSHPRSPTRHTHLSSSKQKSPLQFMLHCRNHGRPLETNVSPEHSENRSRLFSTRARKVVDTRKSESKEHSREKAIARMADSQDGTTKLELFIVGSSGDTLSGSHCLEVEGSRSDHRVLKAAVGVTKGVAKQRAIERDIRKRTDGTSWISVLRKLEANTPHISMAQSYATIAGTAQQLTELYHTLLSDPTYLVTVNYPVTSKGEGSMEVAGSIKSIEEVSKLIVEDEVFDTLTIVETTTANSADPIDKNVALSVQGAKTRKKPMPVDFVMTPGEWTKTSLAEYVHAMTTSRPPEVLHQGVAHKYIVEKSLVELFYNPSSTRNAISWGALHQAVSYLVRQRRTRQARDFLANMARIGFPPTVEFFNIFLRGCAEEQNMSAFNDFLTIMDNDRIPPNEESWIALMIGSPTVEAKQVIARAALTRGFAIRPAFARENAPVLIPFSFGPFLDAGGLVSSYLETLDNIYSPHWVSDAAVKHLIDALAARGRTTEAVKLVDHFILQRKYEPDKSGLHILLRHCARHVDADLAVWLLVYSSRVWRTKVLDHIILEVLFKIAWDARMYNLLRVVWKYAAAIGEATYGMRKIVNTSLVQRLEPAVDSVLGHWRASAGTVACGVDPLSKTNLTSAAILDAERRLYGSRPVLPFTLMLAEALFLDKKWSVDRVKKTRGTTWRLQNCIQIPLIRAFRPAKEESLGKVVRTWRRYRRSGLRTVGSVAEHREKMLRLRIGEPMLVLS